jgi:hypothetical protein
MSRDAASVPGTASGERGMLEPQQHPFPCGFQKDEGDKGGGHSGPWRQSPIAHLSSGEPEDRVRDSGSLRF